MALPMLEAFGGPLALDGNDQLWITGDDQMAAYSLTAQTIRARFPVGGIRALVANDTHVFALRPDAAEVLALSVTASENTPPTPIRTGGMPRSLALDGTALFVADQAGRIVRVPVFPDLGAPEELAIGLPPIETITVADDRIYLIIDGGRIAYLPKR